jgi:hypothetical protein
LQEIVVLQAFPVKYPSGLWPTREARDIVKIRQKFSIFFLLLRKIGALLTETLDKTLPNVGSHSVKLG